MTDTYNDGKCNGILENLTFFSTTTMERESKELDWKLTAISLTIIRRAAFVKMEDWIIPIISNYLPFIRTFSVPDGEEEGEGEGGPTPPGNQISVTYSQYKK